MRKSSFLWLLVVVFALVFMVGGCGGGGGGGGGGGDAGNGGGGGVIGGIENTIDDDFGEIDPDEDGWAITPHKARLNVGEILEITVKEGFPEAARWEIANEEIAEIVSADGTKIRLRALKEGGTRITGYFPDISRYANYSCELTVKNYDYDLIDGTWRVDETVFMILYKDGREAYSFPKPSANTLTLKLDKQLDATYKIRISGQGVSGNSPYGIVNINFDSEAAEHVKKIPFQPVIMGGSKFEMKWLADPGDSEGFRDAYSTLYKGETIISYMRGSESFNDRDDNSTILYDMQIGNYGDIEFAGIMVLLKRIN